MKIKILLIVPLGFEKTVELATSFPDGVQTKCAHMKDLSGTERAKLKWADAFCFVANTETLKTIEYDIARFDVFELDYKQDNEAKIRIIAPIISEADWMSNTTKALVGLQTYPVVDYACGYNAFKLNELAFEITAACCNKQFLFNFIPEGQHPGAFGVKRRHHYHTGVDLYVHRDNADVYPFMPGEIVAYGSFTGAACGSPWWNDTYYIAIKHENIVIVYGEII